MSAMRDTSGMRPTPPMAGRGRDADAVGLVVERDVARDDRVVEHAAGFRHALHGADELAHDLGALGVGEVHVVGDGERIGADGGEVAPRLDDGLLGAHHGIGGDVAGRHVAGRAARPFCVPWMRTTAASPPGRCTVSPITMWSYCSQIQRREQSAGPPIMRLRASSRMAFGAGTHSGRISFGGVAREPRALVDGRRVGERRHRNVGFDLALVA